MRNELNVDAFLTHEIKGLENVNQAIDALHSGDCLRAVVQISEVNLVIEPPKLTPAVVSNIKVHGGYLK